MGARLSEVAERVKDTNSSYEKIGHGNIMYSIVIILNNTFMHVSKL